MWETVECEARDPPTNRGTHRHVGGRIEGRVQETRMESGQVGSGGRGAAMRSAVTDGELL